MLILFSKGRSLLALKSPEAFGMQLIHSKVFIYRFTYICITYFAQDPWMRESANAGSNIRSVGINGGKLEVRVTDATRK